MATHDDGEQCNDLEALWGNRERGFSQARGVADGRDERLRIALSAAELASVEHRDLDAMHLYEDAIRVAGESGFCDNEAIANELAGRFYAARGFEKTARTYLRDARQGYLRSGAHDKVRQLDELYPCPRENEPVPGSAGTIGTPIGTPIGAPIEHLDLATVIKVSQAVSGEIVLDKLLDTLMRMAMAQAGAERGMLILARGNAQRIAAEAATSDDRVSVHLCDEAVAETLLPQAVLHCVLRTGESVVLDDATQSSFAADPYVKEQQVRSILCLPLVAHATLIGALYLENSLVSGVFAPSHVAILKLLASQAAIALENASLYRDLAEREAKIRRLVDANIVGIAIWDLDGLILEANDAFLRIVGYDRDDLQSGRLRWTDLTPTGWLGRHRRGWVPELKITGTFPPYEKEYFRKDGTRVPMLVAAAMFEQNGTQGVGFVLDLSERKRAEAELRKAQTELAHANRITVLGQLTASISHEIKQSISAISFNASTGLRWLAHDPPNIGEATHTLECIVRCTRRAGEVIKRIHGFVKMAPSCSEILQLNEAIREVIMLTCSEADTNGISVRMQLADELPLIQGDRVQLQQVMLNLSINAIDAMRAVDVGPRELTISTALREPDAVLVTVRDSGPGLSPEHVEHLFEPFYTTKASGMGMGLTICRSIIEAHDGQLWASANVPRGAIFQFTVPVHQDA